MPKIKVNDANIYYEIYGQGEPLVFVTGFSADLNAWSNIKDIFAKYYQVIVFDNRGCGQTDAPSYPYSTEMLADDTVGLVQALGLGPCHFIGASLGGCIVQTIARKYPELTKSIVLSCSFPQFNIRGQLHVEARLELMRAHAPDSGIVKFITLLCWSKKYLSQPGMADRIVNAGFFPITLEGYTNQLAALMTFNSREWLNEISCPCLIFAADDDILATPADGEFMHQRIPNSEYYCFQDVGHIPHIEQPEIFNKLVLKFLSNKTINGD